MASASSDTRSVIRTTAASFGYILIEKQKGTLLIIITNYAFVVYDVSRRPTSVDVLRQQSLNFAVTTSCTRCYQTPFPSPYSNRGLACETMLSR